MALPTSNSFDRLSSAACCSMGASLVCLAMNFRPRKYSCWFETLCGSCSLPSSMYGIQEDAVGVLQNQTTLPKVWSNNTERSLSSHEQRRLPQHCTCRFGDLVEPEYVALLELTQSWAVGQSPTLKGRYASKGSARVGPTD